MLNWRHERYVWLPYSGLVADSTFLRLSFDASALLSYLAKFADKEGVVKIDGGPEDSGFSGLTKLVAVELNERVAFRAVVLELVEQRVVTVATGTITIENFKTWQSSPEPRRRLFRCEPSTFACLPAFARMYAAEFVRTADEDGFVGRTLAETLERRTRNKAQSLRAKQRNQYVEKVNRRAAELVTDGFLSVKNCHVSIKNFSAAQMTRSEHAAASASHSRSAPESIAEQPESSGEAAACDLSDRNDLEQSRLLVSSRDVPLTQKAEETPTVSLRSAAIVAHAPTQNDPTRVVPVVTPTAHTGGESRVTTLGLVPDASMRPVAPQHPTQTSMNPQRPRATMLSTLSADPSQTATAPTAPAESPDAPEPAPTPRSARKVPPRGTKVHSDEAPLPFTVVDALGYIAEKAKARFVSGDSKVWGRATFAKVSAAIRAYPNPDDWRLVGEWCAAGWADWKPVSFRWTRTDAFLEAFAVARSWAQNGRELHVSRRKNVPSAAPNATTIPEGYRKNALTAMQRLAKLTGKAVSSGMPETLDGDDDHDYDLSAPDCPVRLAQ